MGHIPYIPGYLRPDPMWENDMEFLRVQNLTHALLIFIQQDDVMNMIHFPYYRAPVSLHSPDGNKMPATSAVHGTVSPLVEINTNSHRLINLTMRYRVTPYSERITI